MKIRQRCSCGQSIAIEDDQKLFINDGGAPDKQDPTYKWEIILADWQTAHVSCLQFVDGEDVSEQCEHIYEKLDYGKVCSICGEYKGD